MYDIANWPILRGLTQPPENTEVKDMISCRRCGNWHLPESCVVPLQIVLPSAEDDRG